MLLTQRFIESCDHADIYPTNLVKQETFVDYNLTDYQERLNDRASELFSPEDKGYLRFWNYDDEEQSNLILEIGGFTGQSLIKNRI
jgi:hypothetical protein